MEKAPVGPTDVMAMPTLYTIDSKGKAREWTIRALKFPEHAILRKEHGMVGGKIVTSDKKTKTVNAGKSNERKPYEQACFMAKSEWQKKYDLGARESVEEARDVEILLPMKAQEVEWLDSETKEIMDRWETVTYPCYVQPKFNGVRCLTEIEVPKVDFISRGGKSYNGALGHLVNPLLEIMKARKLERWIPDAEAYKHGWSLQKISGYVRGYTEGMSEQIQLWIYDEVAEAKDFEERWNYINFMLADVDASGMIIKVPTIKVFSKEQIIQLHDEWTALGFEGLMIRLADSLYEIDRRSYNLLKYKKFLDEEFEIIGYRAAEGTHEGCVIWKCKREFDGKVVEFDVVPTGTLERRRELFKKADEYIGKPLTVKFQEYSDDGVPQGNPVGVAIRDYE